VSNPLVIGIAGGTGSGKTTIARAIADAIRPDVAVLDHDAYYRDQAHLAPEVRAKINFDHPDALDNELLLEHVRALRQWRDVAKPTYDFATHARLRETVAVAAAPVVIVEGILPLAIPALRAEFDVKIFVDTAADIRLMRRIRRDIEQRGRTFGSIRQQYYETVRPMHEAFVEPSKQYADLIIPEGGHNRIAVDMIVGRIRHFLAERGSAAPAEIVRPDVPDDSEG
jgi:uridine kinase